MQTDPNAMTIPAHLQAMAGDGFNEFAAGIGGSRGPHISFNNGQFTLVGTDGVAKPPVNGQGQVLYDPQTGNRYVDIVLIAAGEGLSKVYYEAGFSPGDAAPPDCWSNDGKFPDGMVAAPPAASCAACPFDVFGSKITPAGVQIKACSDRKRVAALYLYDIRGPLYEMSISPSNLKLFAAYSQDLAGRVPGGVRSVVTRVTADTTRVGGLIFSVAPNPATATAQYPQGTGYWFVPEPFMPILIAARNSQECRKAIGADVTPRRAALAAPAGYGQPMIGHDQAPPQSQQVYQQPALAAPQPTYAPPAPVQHFAPVDVAPPQQQYQQPVQQQQVYQQPHDPSQQYQQPQAPAAEAPARKRRTKAEIEAARAAEQQPQQQQPVQQYAPPQGQPTFMPPNAGPTVQPPPPIQQQVVQSAHVPAADPFAPPAGPSGQPQYGSPAPQSGPAPTAPAFDPFGGAPAPVHQQAPQGQPLTAPGGGAPFGVATQPTLTDPALDAMLAQALGPQQ